MKEEYQIEIINMVLQIEDLYFLKEIYAQTQRVLLNQDGTQ